MIFEAVDAVRGVDLRVIGLCGVSGAGKDTVYDNILRNLGYTRIGFRLLFKMAVVASCRATWTDVCDINPKHVRKILQDEITALRDEFSEYIWPDVFKTWLRSLHEIVGVDVTHVAVTDLRFLIEMRGIKNLGGKILHIEPADQLAHVDPELRGHCSEVEMDSPEVQRLCDGYIFNEKKGMDWFARKSLSVLMNWGWA
jgi:hypothetical protein